MWRCVRGARSRSSDSYGATGCCAGFPAGKQGRLGMFLKRTWLFWRWSFYGSGLRNGSSRHCRIGWLSRETNMNPGTWSSRFSGSWGYWLLSCRGFRRSRGSRNLTTILLGSDSQSTNYPSSTAPATFPASARSKVTSVRLAASAKAARYASAHSLGEACCAAV